MSAYVGSSKNLKDLKVRDTPSVGVHEWRPSLLLSLKWRWVKSDLREVLMMSGLDGSGAVHTVLPWEAFGGHVPPGSSEMYWFDQSNSIHLF